MKIRMLLQKGFAPLCIFYHPTYEEFFKTREQAKRIKKEKIAVYTLSAKFFKMKSDKISK